MQCASRAATQPQIRAPHTHGQLKVHRGCCEVRRTRARAFDIHLSASVLDALSHAAHQAPIALERVTFPCQSMNCGDAIYRSTLDAELRMEETAISPWFWLIVALATGYLTAAPGVIQGFWDTYVYAPFLALTQPQLKRDDIRLGSKLAEGGFGQVFNAESRADVPGKVEKGEKLVVKRADEFGEAEVWMNERLSRTAPQAIATFLNAYAEGPPDTGAPLLLAWKWEGKDTLADVMKAKDFPMNVEQVLLGRKLQIKDAPARRAATIKVIVRQLLQHLAAMHRTGIVHRDVKPQNVLIADDGTVKFIDLGAGADLRVGINYVPNEYLLDPRYAPPQQYVMSPLTPRAPPVPLAALLSPVLWRLNQPDRFDMYSVGIILMQLAFPPLRSDTNLIAFNKKIEELDWDLTAWRADVTRRSSRSFDEGFAVLDSNGGAGWDLALKLLEYDHYNRFSAQQALSHSWLDRGKSPFAALRRVGDSIARSSESVLGTVFDTKAFTNMREGLTEAELSSALEEDEEKAPPPDMRSRNTQAWWQSRVKDQQKSGGVLGKLLTPNNEGQRKRRAQTGGGNATQRAYAASGDAAFANGGGSSSGSSGGHNGRKPRPRTGIPADMSSSEDEESPGLQPAVKRAASAGLFSMFDRLKDK